MSVRHRIALVVVVVGATAAPAGAQTNPGANTAPAYPGNTVSVTLADTPLVAGTLVTPDLSGHAEFKDPASDVPYNMSLYVQDAAVAPTCGGSYDEQRQQLINLPGLNATTGFSGLVLDQGFRVAPTPPATGVDWTTPSPRFVVRLGVKKVLLCAYSSYVTDHVAAFGVEYAVDQPTCKPTAGKVKRGRPLTLRCNFSGKVFARLSRGSERVTRTVSLDAKSNRGRFSTKGARKGVNRLRFSLDGKVYGGALKVRVN